MRIKPLILVALSLCTPVMITGCPDSHGIVDLLPAVSGFPASDPSDPCDPQVQALKSDYSFFGDPLVEDAMANAANRLFRNLLSSTRIRYGTKKDTKEITLLDFYEELDKSSLSGSTKGYLSAVGQESTGDYGRISSRVDRDATRDSAKLAAVSRKISALESCRQRQVNGIMKRRGRGKISRMEAVRELDAVQSIVRRDNRLIERIVGRSGERVEVYAEADRYVKTRSLASRHRRSSRPSSAVRKVERNQTQVKRQQTKIGKVDQVIEKKKQVLA